VTSHDVQKVLIVEQIHETGVGGVGIIGESAFDVGTGIPELGVSYREAIHLNCHGDHALALYGPPDYLVTSDPIDVVPKS
jgi:hypothetical protein